MNILRKLDSDLRHNSVRVLVNNAESIEAKYSDLEIGQDVCPDYFESDDSIPGTYVGYGLVAGIGKSSEAIRVSPIDGSGSHCWYRRGLTSVEVQEVRMKLAEMYPLTGCLSLLPVDGLPDRENYEV